MRSEDVSRELQGESGDSERAESTDDAADFIDRHHNEPRVQLYVPKEETFPMPLKYMDVTRSTHTDLDTLWSLCSLTEHGSSASQLAAAKVMDVIARLPDCDGQAADAVSAYTQVKIGGCSQIARNSKIRMSSRMDTSSTTQMTKIMGRIEDPVVLLERNFNGHQFAGLLWERQFEEALLELGSEKVPNWKCIIAHRKQGLFLSVYVDDIKMAGKKQNVGPCGRHS